MALLEIREYGKDDVLLKVCKPVKELTPRLKTLIEDMYDTMYDADGVGLAAPQVGVLRRICVIDIGEGPVTLINPEVLETSGEQSGNEGCLSGSGKDFSDYQFECLGGNTSRSYSFNIVLGFSIICFVKILSAEFFDLLNKFGHLLLIFICHGV